MNETLLAHKEHLVREKLRNWQRVALGFSGGVDSMLLLYLAVDELGVDNVLVLIADTPTLPRRELAAAIRLAKQLGATYKTVTTAEFKDEEFLRNPPERCYICKQHIFGALRRAASELAFLHLLDGNNADDRSDFRPGERAARELGVKSPFMEAEMTKAEIRRLSLKFGLETATKPAMACLASRIPYGSRIGLETLAQIEAAEAALHAIGFLLCRVRHHGAVARIELNDDDMARMLVPAVRHKVAAALAAAGYSYITLDLQGYRMGSLNEALPSE